ncbi:MAG: glycine--tRNA ligase [Planctomycetota bacterium]
MAKPPANTSPLDPIVSLCKKRGFVYPASEIYGGINGFWDYGPLGVLLKNNIRDHWWRCMVECPPIGPDGVPLQIVGLDSSIIQNPKTWEASGHVGGFSDPMVDCTESKRRYRADHLFLATAFANDGTEIGTFSTLCEGDEAVDDLIRRAKKASKGKSLDDTAIRAETVLCYVDIARDLQEKVIGPDASKPGTLTKPREFNLMFQTYVGAIQSDDAKAYLRPETAQGIFLNYKNVVDTTRVKMPFGIAQVGKSFRNEVTPRNFIFRSREFEQMELEWFCDPDESGKWYDFWKQARMDWWLSLGVDPDNLIFRDHEDDELSHYSNMTVDIEYKYPFTAPEYGELEGIAHRGCFDLTQHQEHSGAKMEYFDQEKQLRLKDEGASPEEVKEKSRYIPNVIEPASGLTRAVLVVLCEAYTVDPDRPSGVYMKFKPKFAPIKAGIFPLVNKDGMPEKATEIYRELREVMTCEYDPKQSIGKRYARMDEIGAPFCVTVDGDTATDDSVTVRHRDDQSQERVKVAELKAYLLERLAD